MPNPKNPLSDPKAWSAETQLVHGGSLRSEFNETSEAIFMNSGYSYPSSQHAEDLFLNKLNGHHYNYSRFANPTLEMFQERMARSKFAGSRPSTSVEGTPKRGIRSSTT